MILYVFVPETRKQESTHFRVPPAMLVSGPNIFIVLRCAAAVWRRLCFVRGGRGGRGGGGGRGRRRIDEDILLLVVVLGWCSCSSSSAASSAAL